MEPEPSNVEQALPPEQAAAKAAILAECERLAEAGITFVSAASAGDVYCFTISPRAVASSASTI